MLNYQRTMTFEVYPFLLNHLMLMLFVLYGMQHRPYNEKIAKTNKNQMNLIAIKMIQFEFYFSECTKFNGCSEPLVTIDVAKDLCVCKRPFWRDNSDCNQMPSTEN